MHPVFDQPPPLRVNPYAGKRRRRKGPLSWGARWFLILVATVISFSILDDGDNAAWVDTLLGGLYLVYWVAAWACVILLARFLWRSARRALGRV